MEYPGFKVACKTYFVRTQYMTSLEWQSMDKHTFWWVKYVILRRLSKVLKMCLDSFWTYPDRLSHWSWAHIPHHTCILRQAPAIHPLCCSAFLVASHLAIGYGVHTSQSPEQEKWAPPPRAWLGRRPGIDWLLGSGDKILTRPWATHTLRYLLLLTQT